MLTLALALTLSASAPPRVGFVRGESVKVSPEKERAVYELLAAELLANELGTRRLETSCGGAIDCVTRAAAAQDLWAVLVLTLGGAGQDVVVDLEAYRVSDRSSLGHVTFTVKRQRLERAQQESLAGLAAQTRKAAPAESPPPPVPVAATEETPPPPAPPAALEATPEPEPAPRSKLAPALLLVGGGLAAAASGGFGGWGLTEKQRLEASPDGLRSSLTRGEALGLRDSANGHFTVALGAGVLAGALLLAGVLWLLLE